MVQAAKRICTRPGCRGLYDAATGACSVCGPRPAGWASDHERGTRQERGYDDDWLRLRNAHIRANPLCASCLRRGRTRLASEVDHIRPFQGLDDPLRLATDNLQSLCRPCHHEKTRRQ